MTLNPDLVVRSSTGDHAAFSKLVATHHAMIVSVCFSIVRDMPTAEDMAQQSFTEAWQSLGTLEDPSRFSGWIRQIAVHRSRNVVRRRGRAARAHAHAAPSQTPDPEQSAVLHDDIRVLREALDRLDEQDRLLLTLYYWHEQDAPRTAAQLGTSAAAVRQRLSRLRRMLRTEVETAWSESVGARKSTAAFTAAVMLFIRRPQPTVRAARWRAGLVCAAALVMLAIGRRPVAQASDPPSPESTPVSSRAPAIRPAAVAPPEEPRSASVPTPYTFKLTLDRELFRSTGIGDRIQPARLLPSMDTVDVPRLPVIAQLERVLALEPHELRAQPALEDELFRLAEADGLTLDQVDPEQSWAVIAAVEVYRRQQQRQQDERMVARFEHKKATGTWGPLAYQTLVPILELTSKAALHASSDRVKAILGYYQLYAMLTPTADTTAPESAVRYMELMFAKLQDEGVREQVVELFVQHVGRPPAMTDAQRTLLVKGLRPEVEERARWMFVESSFAAGELDRARADLEDYAAVLRILCPHWPVADALQATEMSEGECRLFTDHAERLSGRLAAMGSGTAMPTWRAALAEAAWRCDETHTPPASTAADTISENGSWNWEAWQPGNDFTRCLDAARPSLPTPVKGRAVRLVVEAR